MPPQSLTSFWLALQFFSPTVVENNIDADGGGVIISMPRDKVTKSAVQALVDGTTGLSSAAQVEVSTLPNVSELPPGLHCRLSPVFGTAPTLSTLLVP